MLVCRETLYLHILSCLFLVINHYYYYYHYSLCLSLGFGNVYRIQRIIVNFENTVFIHLKIDFFSFPEKQRIGTADVLERQISILCGSYALT